MNTNLTAESSIEIKSTPKAVWNTLTNPDKIKIYLFGTETITDWKVGSPIVFQGNYEGHSYKDKGNVLEVIPNQLLKYNYWSSMSGLDDKIENYFIVSYIIEEIDGENVKFTWRQEGFPNEERRHHTQTGLIDLLNRIKSISEKDFQGY